MNKLSPTAKGLVQGISHCFLASHSHRRPAFFIADFIGAFIGALFAVAFIADFFGAAFIGAAFIGAAFIGAAFAGGRPAFLGASFAQISGLVLENGSKPRSFLIIFSSSKFWKCIISSPRYPAFPTGENLTV